MRAYQIKELKNFMAKLLATDAFDDFLLAEATITTYNTFIIDGHLVKEFFSGDVNDTDTLPEQAFSQWKDMRSLCFDLIKGKKTPSAFRFVFLLSPENMQKTLNAVGSSYKTSDVTGMYINLKYQNQLLTLTTGVSYTIFST